MILAGALRIPVSRSGWKIPRFLGGPQCQSVGWQGEAIPPTSLLQPHAAVEPSKAAVSYDSSICKAGVVGWSLAWWRLIWQCLAHRDTNPPTGGDLGRLGKGSNQGAKWELTGRCHIYVMSSHLGHPTTSWNAPQIPLQGKWRDLVILYIHQSLLLEFSSTLFQWDLLMLIK